MEQSAIRNIPKGTYFRFTGTPTAPVWVRGAYVPSARKYSVHKFDDVNHERLVKGTQQVYINFTY